MKNQCGKLRKVGQPYEIWQSKDGRWEWKVLKKYQAPENEIKNNFARWFCAVRSPFTYGSYEFGDTYIKDVVTGNKCVYRDELDFSSIEVKEK